MNLHLPQLNANEDDISRSPNTLRMAKRWLTELPLINMGETTRIFYMTQRLLNRQKLPIKVRYEIMEQFRPTARIVLMHLKKHLTSPSYPLTGKTKQIAKLEHALLLELSVGYKHILHSVANFDDKLDRKALVITTHRAMRYLEEAISCNANVYYTNMPGTWHDLHRLQGYAESNHLAEIEVDDDEFQTITHSTITDVFKQACLLSMSHPFRLRTGEANKLRTYFETACHLCDLTKTLEPNADGLLHVISLKSSEPPAYIPLADITTFSNLRGFDPSRLISTLSDMSQATEDEEYTPGFSKVELDPQLIKRLITSWTEQEKRRFNRVSTHRRVVTAIGLKNIIHAISNDVYPDLAKDDLVDTRNTDSHTETSYFDGFTAQLDGPSIKREDSYEIDPTYYGDIVHSSNTAYTLKAIKEVPESWHEWEVVNTGAGGYGLLWGHDSPSPAQVGELIALREREYNVHHWRVGVIRWLRNSPHKGLEIGLQLIAPRSVVVSIESIQNRRHSEEMPLDALMLPGLKAIKQPPSLLVPSQIFTVSDILEVSVLGKKLDIELKKIGESPSFYTQFFYRSSEIMQAASAKDDFDELWNRL
ncbi:MAG: hypothetical protein DSZ28_00840 [Thiothrix sp.]|nr:MAG: hypothetical protein DSZ28_00840 [Thiothrix sp.]